MCSKMGIKIHWGFLKKHTWRIKWKQGFPPILICVFVREQHSWLKLCGMWTVGQNILWRSSSLWIIQKYTHKKSLCCSQFPLLLLWLKIGIPDSSSFVQSFFSSINLELWMLPPSSAVVYSWGGGNVQMLFLSNNSSHGQANGVSQDWESSSTPSLPSDRFENLWKSICSQFGIIFYTACG